MHLQPAARTYYTRYSPRIHGNPQLCPARLKISSAYHTPVEDLPRPLPWSRSLCSGLPQRSPLTLSSHFHIRLCYFTMAASLESRAVQVDTSVRHQLASPWTWSELRSDKKEGESWSHLRYKICTVDTVEDFWKAWTNIVKPTEAFKSKEGTAVITREDEDEDAVDAAGKRRSRSSRISQLAVFKDDIEPLGEYNDHKTNLMRLRMRSSTLSM